MPQSFRAEPATLRPLVSQVDGGISYGHLGVRDLAPHLKAERFFCAKSFLIEGDCLGGISECQFWGCSRAHGCDGFGYGRHTFSSSQFRFQSCLELCIRQIAQFRRDAH